MSKIVLKIENLIQYFRNYEFSQFVDFNPFVTHINFHINENEIFGIVGQSGSGKTTLGRCLIGLNTTMTGKIIYKNQDLIPLNQDGNNPFRKEIQMIFQNPRSALNMNMTTYELIREAVALINKDKNEIEKITEKLIVQFELVNIRNQYPYLLSGGERRRVGIARVLALSPKILIADEPVSMLDASIRTEVMNLMEDLQKKYNLTYIFITHDLAQARYIGR